MGPHQFANDDKYEHVRLEKGNQLMRRAQSCVILDDPGTQKENNHPLYYPSTYMFHLGGSLNEPK